MDALEELLRELPENEAAAFDRAAAAVLLAVIPIDEPMPATLRARIIKDAASGRTR
jgi:hypothetical protein